MVQFQWMIRFQVRINFDVHGKIKSEMRNKINFVQNKKDFPF